MRSSLHFQADRIELLLAAHKLPARVTGGTVSSSLVRFHISTPLSVQVRQVERLSEDIALSLGAASCRVFREHGQLQVEVPRTDPKPVLLMDLCRRLQAGTGSPVPALSAVLGVDTDGVPLLLRLSSADVAHILIAGTTGSGKTALARSIVASLAIFNPASALQMILVDPKGRGFSPFCDLPHLMLPVLGSPDLVLPVLGRLVSEMETRDAQRRSHPCILVVIDELADLVQSGGRDMHSLITRLTQRGREAGIHLVACTQKPTSLSIGSLVKSNFPVRLVGSVVSPEDAKVASGLASTGAHLLLGHGDFLLVARGFAKRFQAAFLPSDTIGTIVETIRLCARGESSSLLLDRPAGSQTKATGTDSAPSLMARLRPGALRPPPSQKSDAYHVSRRI